MIDVTGACHSKFSTVNAQSDLIKWQKYTIKTNNLLHTTDKFISVDCYYNALNVRLSFGDIAENSKLMTQITVIFVDNFFSRTWWIGAKCTRHNNYKNL